MFLFVGLGNPDPKHKNNRHNIGFIIIDSLNKRFNLSKQKPKFKGLLTNGEINNQKLILVGHSWGGMLSFSYAANEPEKIEKIILLNTGGVTDKFYSWFGSNINMRLFPEDLELYQSQIDNKRSTLVAIWPGYFFDREMALKSRPALDYKFNNQAGINSLASGDWRKRSEERVEKLKNYNGPIDLITGRQDPVGESVVYEAKTVFPQLNYTFIERCGHFPWLEREDRSKIFYDLFDKSLDLN